MNYWPAETCHLSECHEPLIRMVGELSQSGSRTACEHYGCRGWTAHHNVDLWRKSTPASGEASWAFWPMAGAWLSRHLWEHYAFNPDAEYLRAVYPIIKGAAQFCLDWLVEGPKGFWVTIPSTSPENKFVTPQGNPCSVSMASTMDMALIRDVFRHCIEAGRILQVDEDWRKRLEAVQSNLFPYQIGRHGQLQEWFQDFDEHEPGHRHFSHLYGLFPGNDRELVGNRAFTEACRTALERRVAHGSGHTGWSAAWLVNLFARLQDGDRAYHFFRKLLSDSTHPNLFADHPPFQIDGNFGGTAGVAEMLVQSHKDEIHFLPALPGAWPRGSVKGLKARGGFLVDIQWKDHAVQRAVIQSTVGSLCRVRCDRTLSVKNADGKLQKGLLSFSTKAGVVYELIPEPEGIR